MEKLFDWAIIVSIGYAAIYLLFVFSARRQEMVNRITHGLIVYAVLSAVWEVLWGIYHWGLFDFIASDLGSWLVTFGIVILALVFLICTLLFLQMKSSFWTWAGISAGFAAVGFTLFISFFPLPESFRILILTLLASGWVAVSVTASYVTIQSVHQAKRPQYKNRIGSWGLALGFTIIGDLILFAGVVTGFTGTVSSYPAVLWVIGSIFHMVGVLTAGFVALVHESINLGGGILRLLSYLAVTLVGVFVIVFFLELDLTNLPMIQSETLERIIKAITLVVFVVPGLSWLYGYVNRLIFGPGVNRSTAVREYGLSISNLVDLNKLSEVALNFLDRTLGVEFSMLLLVDDLAKDEYYHLLPLPNPSKERSTPVNPGQIGKANVFAEHFLVERRALTQYELDFLPKFQKPSPEKEWLANLRGEIYVPILTSESWIGLFVLGPKKTGNQFFGDDIDLLNTLAHQTVAALQNARLFSNLRRLNNDLRKTYKALEEANKKLLEVDELKSTFISVVTHEMRTPLANMALSLQVFERSGVQNLLPDQQDQLDQIENGLKTSRNMIDNLITMAAFLNKQATLTVETFDFGEILDKVRPLFKEKVDEKGLRFKVDQVGEAKVVGDRKLLTTAVSNLVENAIKFTHRNGYVWISCWTTENALWLDVRDTGQGIPKEKLEKVWQSFTQLRADPVRRSVEGLGLGLSLVKQIILAHGGQVFVESEADAGSVFGFRIPLKGPEFPLKKVLLEPSRKEIMGLPLN